MIKDTLIGETTVLVRREREPDIEFERIGENRVSGDEESLDDEVIDAVRDNGFEFKTVYPFEVELYFHDEAEPDGRRIVADKMPAQFESDDDLVRELAGLGYEIQMTARVTSETDWEITHILGHELKEPYTR